MLQLHLCGGMLTFSTLLSELLVNDSNGRPNKYIGILFLEMGLDVSSVCASHTFHGLPVPSLPHSPIVGICLAILVNRTNGMSNKRLHIHVGRGMNV